MANPTSYPGTKLPSAGVDPLTFAASLRKQEDAQRVKQKAAEMKEEIDLNGLMGKAWKAHVPGLVKEYDTWKKWQMDRMRDGTFKNPEVQLQNQQKKNALYTKAKASSAFPEWVRDASKELARKDVVYTNAPDVLKYINSDIDEWINSDVPRLNPYADWRKDAASQAPNLIKAISSVSPTGGQTEEISSQRVYDFSRSMAASPQYKQSIEYDLSLPENAGVFDRAKEKGVTPQEQIVYEHLQPMVSKSEKPGSKAGKGGAGKGFGAGEKYAAQNLVNDLSAKLVGSEDAYTEVINSQDIINLANSAIQTWGRAANKNRQFPTNFPITQLRKASNPQYSGAAIGEKKTDSNGNLVFDETTGNIYYDDTNNISLWEVIDAKTKETKLVPVSQTQAYNFYKRIAENERVNPNAVESFMRETGVFDINGNITRPDVLAKGKWKYNPSTGKMQPATQSGGQQQQQPAPQTKGQQQNQPRVNVLPLQTKQGTQQPAKAAGTPKHNLLNP